MSDSNTLRETIDRLVATAIEAHATELRKQLTAQILAEIAQSSAAQPAAPIGSATGLLNGAIHTVHGAATQTEILKALLEGSGNFSQRSGLLVVRGSTAQGWQSRGFDDDYAFRTMSVDCMQGLAGRVLQTHAPAAGTVSDFDEAFARRFGAPIDGNVILLPLIIKEKVAAMLYADGGTKGPSLDTSALELLVHSAAMWLELQTLRRAAGLPEPVHRLNDQPVRQPVIAVPPEPEPVSVPIVAERPTAPEPVPEAIATPPVDVPVNGGNNGNGHARVAAAAVVEDEVHNKARRFAKLLVDEIKLYNQSKVAEGRQARDLYQRLKDDIEKSRATYERRYGSMVSDVDYFKQELVKVLADNNPALLGANFS